MLALARPSVAQPISGPTADAATKRYLEIIGDVPGYRVRRQQPLATRSTDEVALLMQDPMESTAASSVSVSQRVFRQYDPDGDRPIAGVGDTLRLMHRDGRLEAAVVAHRAYFEVDAGSAMADCTIYAPTWFFSVQRRTSSSTASTPVDGSDRGPESSPSDEGLIALPSRVSRTYALTERPGIPADVRLLRGVMDSLSARRLLGTSGGGPRGRSALLSVGRDLAAGRVPRGLRVATTEVPGQPAAERVFVYRIPVSTDEMCEENYGVEYPSDCKGYYVAPVRLVMRGDGRLLGVINAWWNDHAQDIRAIYETPDGERGLVTGAGLASFRAGWMQLRTEGPRVDRLTSDCM